nr:transglycosylase SLT domain-containing protein [Paraburkholderia sp. LEh10]
MSPPILRAVAWRESRDRPDAVHVNANGSVDFGLMQTLHFMGEQISMGERKAPRESRRATSAAAMETRAVATRATRECAASHRGGIPDPQGARGSDR